MTLQVQVLLSALSNTYIFFKKYILYDNRLENLQILCSNCHTIEHNYSNVKNDRSEVNTELLEKVLSEEVIFVDSGTKIKKKEKIVEIL